MKGVIHMKKKLSTVLCSLLLLSACGNGNSSANYTAGTYTATNKGFGGNITVTLTVSDKKIETVEIIGEKETPELGGKAIETITQSINDGKELEVVSGATITSEAVINAYNNALSQAKGESEEVSDKKVADGKWTTKAMGHEDWVHVTTQFKDGAIVKCTTTAHEETMGIGNFAAARVPAQILEAQSVEVDGVSGATVTTNAIKQAVKEAISLAGGDVASFSIPVEKEVVESTQDVNYDVIVVGAGNAGLVAATRLAEKGLNVGVFEKMDIPGGSMPTTYSGIMNSYSESVAKYALDAEKESASWNMELILPVFQAMLNPEYDRFNGEQPYQKVMLQQAGKVVDWLDEIGVGFASYGYFEGGLSYGITPYLAPGCYQGGAGYAAMSLAQRMEKLGADVHYATPVTQLVTDENNTVTGVIAKSEDGTTYNASAKAVLLCTGGFGANQEMVDQYYPEYAGMTLNCTPGSTGDGILMAQEIGADIECMGRFLGMFMSEYGSNYELAFMHQSTPGIMVNINGDEFGNITKSNHTVLSNAMMDETNGKTFYYIYDDEAMQSTVDYDAYGFSYKSIFEREATKHYDTVEEAAKALNLPNLVETISKNNEFALSGEANEFGRKNCPYIETRDGIWVTHVIPTPYLTTGGLVTDVDTHVIDTEGNVINGLYAAGDVAGSIEEKDGKTYGNGFDQALAFGYQAAEVISNEIH